MPCRKARSSASVLSNAEILTPPAGESGIGLAMVADALPT